MFSDFDSLYFEASRRPSGVAAEAIGKRKGVAASAADCCGSGFPCGQDIVLMSLHAGPQGVTTSVVDSAADVSVVR